MEKQLIISVGREFGSGGHVIAEALAERFELILYDQNILKQIEKEKHLADEHLEKFDEKPKHRLLSRTVRGYSSSPQENVADMQFEFLKRQAEKGDSFVVVGRCSETILKGKKGLVSIFVLGDKEIKQERVKEVYQVSDEEARHMMEHQDRLRKSYHNYFCKGKWGDARNYDLSVNSSKLGIDTTVNVLEVYIRARMEQD